MPRHAQLDATLKRLSAALDQLEAASARLGKAGAEKRDLIDTLAVMEHDRSRLADDLDSSLTRTRTLERAADEVAHGLARAGVVLRRLVETGG